MTETSYCTPLVGLDAVVLDIEATGLDSTTARIVQIGAIKVHGGVIDKYRCFNRLVNPDIPIPPSSTTIHGIADADVATAAPFKDVWPELRDFIGTSILVGHATAYDLAVLQRECQLAGIEWRPRHALDIRTLAQIAAPTLAGHSLDSLCAWLDIKIEGRHTALGDATATARAFLALLPQLRAKNVRTLAEAEAATRHAIERDAQAAGGLMATFEDAPTGKATDEPDDKVQGPLMRTDTYPYRHRVYEVMGMPPVRVSPNDTMHEVSRTLINRKVSSAFVEIGDGRHGIVTERDIMRAIASRGADALARPVADIMNTPLQSISDQAFLYRAIARMQRFGFRHLGVHNANGEIIGALTMRDLLRYRASSAIALGDEIDVANTVGELSQAWAKLPVIAKELIAEDVRAFTIANVISSELRVLTRRASQLAEARMKDAGHGAPPVPYAVLVLGSAGRGESLLAADQDNAIIFNSGEPGGPEDRWFEKLGRHLSDILDEVGVPYCKGGVMARNAAWRMSFADWKGMIESWVRRQRPKDLLNVDIFFDGIPVFGDVALGEAIWEHAYACGSQSTPFIKLLTEAARIPGGQAFTLFGGFRRDEKGRVDLKKVGLFPIITAARVLSIKYDARARSTPERFREIAAKGAASPDAIERLLVAHETIIRSILEQQITDIADGVPPGNKVATARLDRAQRAALKAAVADVYIATDLVGEGRI